MDKNREEKVPTWETTYGGKLVYKKKQGGKDLVEKIPRGKRTGDEKTGVEKTGGKRPGAKYRSRIFGISVFWMVP